MTSIPNKDRILFPMWLLRSKVCPNKQRVSVLPRQSLLRKLHANHPQTTLTLVHAPAGFGKSTLLANWRRQLLQDQQRVAWLSLEKEDNDPVHLIIYIAFALSEAGIDFHKFLPNDFSFHNEQSCRRVLSLICRAAEHENERITLIFDDFENLEARAINDTILPLLNYAPTNLHVAIGTREVGKLSITNLYVDGLVVDLHANDMRFTIDELKKFFLNDQSEQSINHLYKLTDGWPVVAQLFKRAFDSGVCFNDINLKYDKGVELLTTYLSEQVFGNLENSLQSFLIEVSITVHIDCDFADFVREKRDSVAKFNQLIELAPLILPYEGIADTYRMHPLFRDFLYQKLRVNEPDRFAFLHSRAADWFTQAGDLSSAVMHCVKGHAPHKAADVIEKFGGLLLWPKEGLSRLRTVIKLLDEKTIQSRIRIRIIKCLLDIKDGKISDARQDFETLLIDFNENIVENMNKGSKVISHDILLIETLLACYEGKVLSDGLCIQLIEHAEQTEAQNHSVLSHHFSLLCLSYIQKGQFELAEQFAQKALLECRHMDSDYGEAYINFHLGSLCFFRGECAAADDLYNKGLNTSRQHFADDKGMRLVASVLLSELHYETGDEKYSHYALESIPKKLEIQEAWFDIYAAGYMTCCYIEHQKYGIQAALSIVKKASLYAADQRLHRLSRFLLLLNLDLLLRHADQNAIDKFISDKAPCLTDFLESDTSEKSIREKELSVYVLSKLDIKNNKLEDAIGRLEVSAFQAEKNMQVRSNIKHEILLGVCNFIQGKVAIAHDHIERALTLYERTGLVRAFLDEMNQIKELLDSYLKSKAQKVYVAKSLVDKYFGEESNNELSPGLLSKRENDVLKQLSLGYSNKLIARNIDISDNTVRFHLKNIFNKLHVTNRAQAVLVARDRSLI